jgi:hypothetical protein
MITMATITLAAAPPAVKPLSVYSEPVLASVELNCESPSVPYCHFLSFALHQALAKLVI